MAARAIAVCCLSAVVLLGAYRGSPLQSAHVKLNRIENDRAPRGASIVFTAQELRDYAIEQAALIAPGALRETTLKLSPAHAETITLINFLRVRQAEGHEDNWLTRQLLDGERRVRVRVRFQSTNGRARVDVERVEVSGIAMQGDTLDFLLRNFLIPSFPEARAGSWFALGHRIERLEALDGAVRIVIRK